MEGITVHEMLKLSSPKVIAMYEAVGCLMEEGRDLYTLKVSDITEKAGIGKGTAYEYFDTKDELISKAIFYQIQSSVRRMAKAVEKEESFREKMYALMTYMDKNHSRYQMLTKSLCYYIQGLFREKQWMNQLECSVREDEEMRDFFKGLLVQAAGEGLAREDLPGYFMQSAVVTQILAYSMHIGGGFGAEEIRQETMKEYTYKSILAALQTAGELV